MAGRVLVIDDAAMVRAVVCTHLRLAGHEVVGEAADGAEGVALARALNPDGIVIDFHMPKMDGVEATRRIRAELPDAKIVVFSSSEDPTAHTQVVGAGADAYVPKSSKSIEPLIDVIDRLLSTPPQPAAGTLAG